MGVNNYSCLVIHINYIIYIQLSVNFQLYHEKSMGIFGIFSAIVPAVGQKESAHGTVSF